MADLIGRHYFLSGKVQGVWFRASTKEQADLLGVTGWVRNLSDGRVEVLAYGEKDQIEKLHIWLQKGPERALVSDFFCEEQPWQACQAFLVK